jgi:hypothetical protein
MQIRDVDNRQALKDGDVKVYTIVRGGIEASVSSSIPSPPVSVLVAVPRPSFLKSHWKLPGK